MHHFLITKGSGEKGEWKVLVPFERLVEIFTETDEKPQKDDEYRGAVAAGAAMLSLSQPLSKTS